MFFDINAVADHSTDLPHMLPGPDQFGAAAGDLGISEKDTIVAYDGTGLYSAPRVWWTFRIFGARNVYILDGGLPAWKAEGRATEAGTVKRSRAGGHHTPLARVGSKMADSRAVVRPKRIRDRESEKGRKRERRLSLGLHVLHRARPPRQSEYRSAFACGV